MPVHFERQCTVVRKKRLDGYYEVQGTRINVKEGEGEGKKKEEEEKVII